jgi:hypothetical protein
MSTNKRELPCIQLFHKRKDSSNRIGWSWLQRGQRYEMWQERWPCNINFEVGQSKLQTCSDAVYEVIPSADVLRREGEVQLLVSQKLRTSIELA